MGSLNLKQLNVHDRLFIDLRISGQPKADPGEQTVSQRGNNLLLKKSTHHLDIQQFVVAATTTGA